MGVRKTGCFVVFLVLLCPLVTVVGLGSRKKTEEVVLGDLGDSASWEIDEGMAEVLWNYCGPDLIDMKEAIEDLELCIPGKMSCSINDISSKSPLLTKENMRKTVSIRHPIMKQTLLDCLVRKHLLVRVSGEEDQSKNWYIEYLESIFLRYDVSRGNLGRELLQSIVETPSPAPSPVVQSPIFSPAPSPESASSGSQPPAMSPTSTVFAPDINSSFQPPSGDGDGSSASPPTSGSSAQLNKKSNIHKSVVIAVAVTASVTFVIAALLFLCYTRVWKNGTGFRRRNDERPINSLSLSEYSIGNSINKEKIGRDSYGSLYSQNQEASALNDTCYTESNILNSSVNQAVSLGAIGGASKYSVESSDPSSSMNAQVPSPPLKPPPGRVGNSPPSSNPPPSRADPPPPVSDPPPVPPPSLKPSGGAGPPPPPPGPPPLPPKPPGISSGSRPPPPLKSGRAPPPPPPPMALGSKASRPPLGPNRPLNTASGDKVGADDDEPDAPKAKLKPFFWDKVLANPDHSMVWHQIKSGSFQFDEEMIETLFGYAPPEKNKNEYNKGSSSQERPAQFIQIIDSKKAQNLSILLRGVNVTTEEVCDALQEGNDLPVELLQTLLKMGPTSEEELKLRLFNGELSQLGPADRFLKALVDIPFAFKRLESLLFMSSFPEEVSITKESFATLEVACKELRNSRLFLKLLEAVLKTGNRMNNGTFRGGAQAFKLDTLLKLSDVKGTDGKTTLLHFVVQEIIRSEGVRAARAAGASQSISSVKSDDLLEDSSRDTEERYRSLGLEVVSGLGGELENVKKAANLDADSLSGTVTKLGHALVKTRDFLNSEINLIEEENGFRRTLESFVQNAEIDIMWLSEEEKRIMALVKGTGDYFHGNAGKDDGLRLFVIVRDFLIMLDKSCKEVRDAPKRDIRTQKKEASAVASSSNPCQPPSPDIRSLLFPAITDRRVYSSSSDDETP